MRLAIRGAGRNLDATNHPFVLLAAVLALAVGQAAAVAAQDATPGAFPLTPDPLECTIAPRLVAAIIALAGTPGADQAVPPTASPPPFVPPAGAPADAATVAAVTATVRAVVACANARNTRALLALATDDYVRRFLAGRDPADPAFVAALGATPVAEPPEGWTTLVRLAWVRVLPDGRVGALVVLDRPQDPRPEEPTFVVLAPRGDRWLIDEVATDVPDAGTPVAGNPPLARAPVTVGGIVVDAELARTPREQRLGLAYRAGLAPGAGMLFVFDRPEVRSVWMQGMRFCLDIVWIEGGRVVGAAEHVCPPPPGTPAAQLPQYRSPIPVRYVLEVPAGWLASHGLGTGSPVTISLPGTENAESTPTT